MKYNLLLLAFSLLLFQCSHKVDDRGDRLKVSMVNGEIKDPNCEKQDSACFSLHWFYPEFSSQSIPVKWINDSIRSVVSGAISLSEQNSDSTLVQLAQSTFAEFKEFRNEFPQSAQVWNANVTSKFESKTDQYWSFYLESTTYFGGAHPNTSRVYYNVDPNTGKSISRESLQLNSNEFLNKVEFYLRQKFEIPDTESLEDHGFWINGDQLPLPDNFGLKEDRSVVLYYNPYEIAPYSMGSIELVVPM